MPNLCKLTLIGHVGRDAELKYTAKGTAILEWTLAVNEKGYGENAQDKTHWFRCSVFGKRAESLKTLIEKGKPLYVEGQFSPREYTKDGQTRTSYDVRVSEVELLGGRSGSERQPARNENPYANEPGGSDDFPF